jgi:carboxyl-terminal processing protease
METWNLTNYTKFSTNGSVNLTLDDVFNPVQYIILDSGYGYLKNRILVEFDSQGNLLPTYNKIYNSFKEAIDLFNTAKVPGVIIDVRDNPGGFDRLAALFGSFFYDHTELYEHASFYNPQSGQFEVIGSFTIYLESQSSYYGGPVICLVNPGTASSAEGVAMAIQRLSQCHVSFARGRKLYG